MSLATMKPTASDIMPISNFVMITKPEYIAQPMAAPMIPISRARGNAPSALGAGAVGGGGGGAYWAVPNCGLSGMAGTYHERRWLQRDFWVPLIDLIPG